MNFGLKLRSVSLVEWTSILKWHFVQTLQRLTIKLGQSKIELKRSSLFGDIIITLILILHPFKMFLKDQPQSLFHLFPVFSNKQYNFYNKSMWKMSCPSGLWCWDSNPRPLEHDSSPIITRPVLPPVQNVIPTVSSTQQLSRKMQKMRTNRFMRRRDFPECGPPKLKFKSHLKWLLHHESKFRSCSSSQRREKSAWARSRGCRPSVKRDYRDRRREELAAVSMSQVEMIAAGRGQIWNKNSEIQFKIFVKKLIDNKKDANVDRLRLAASKFQQ